MVRLFICDGCYRRRPHPRRAPLNGATFGPTGCYGPETGCTDTGEEAATRGRFGRHSAAMATSSPPKVRRRTLDHLRQKLWAVPARLRLRLVHRSAAAPSRPRAYRSTTIR